MTPIVTTNIDMKVALNDLKKRKKIKLVSNMAETTKIYFVQIFWAFNVLM